MADTSLDDVTIGVLTVLPEEFAAACELLGCHSLVEIRGRNYRLGSLKRFDQRESHVVVVCRASDMGTATIAAKMSTLLQDSKNVRFVIMCGIAGAVPNPRKPSDHVRLGDIVVLSRRGVVQYDFVKEVEDGTQIRERWNQPSRAFLDAAQQLTLREQLGDRPWERYIALGIQELEKNSRGASWRRPTVEHDELKEFNGRFKDYVTWVARRMRIRGALSNYRPIPHPVDERRISDAPRVFHGVIASANNLQKNPHRRDLLRDRFGAMAVEMEGAGVGDAAYEADIQFIIVRGTCDYCNGDKNDDWHNYAAVAAAAYTRALLEMVPLQPILAPASRHPLVPVGKTEAVRTENIPHPPKESGELEVSANIPRAAEIAVQNELNDTLDEILKSQVAEGARKIALALDSLELQKAFDEADKLDNVARTAAKKLSPELLGLAYEWLARVAIIRGRENGNITEGVKKAEEFIARAKNVNSK
jgi:nucleoside phosphorylase